MPTNDFLKSALIRQFQIYLTSIAKFLQASKELLTALREMGHMELDAQQLNLPTEVEHRRTGNHNPHIFGVRTGLTRE